MGMEDKHVLDGQREIGPLVGMRMRHVCQHMWRRQGMVVGATKRPGQAMAS